MKLVFNKRFLKDLAQIQVKERSSIETFVFETLLTYKALTDCKKIEKMKGYKSFYKVRFGDYRIGLRYENDVIVLERVLHRKEIYRFFP